MEFDIRKNGTLIEVYNDAGKCLTRKLTTHEVLDDIRAMAAGAELTDDIQVQLIDVLTPMSDGLPAYYNCGICDHWHAEDFNGDCRADDARFYTSDLDEKHGVDGWESVGMPGSEDHA
jgi:hypothetical protein